MEVSTMRLKQLAELVQEILREAEASKKKTNDAWQVARAREILLASGRLVEYE